MANNRIHCGYHSYDQLSDEYQRIEWDPDTRDVILVFADDIDQVVHGLECSVAQPFDPEKQDVPTKSILESKDGYLGLFYAEGKMFILSKNYTYTGYAGRASDGPVETGEYSLFDAE
jgi:hypothetical protein